MLMAGLRHAVSLLCPLSFEDEVFTDLHNCQRTPGQTRSEEVRITQPLGWAVGVRGLLPPAVLITRDEIFKRLQIASIKMVSIPSEPGLAFFDPMSLYV